MPVYRNTSQQVMTIYQDGTPRVCPPGAVVTVDAARAEVYLRAGLLQAVETRADAQPAPAVRLDEPQDKPPRKRRRARKARADG